MALEPSVPGEPFVRTGEQEEADKAEAEKNILDLRFKEWPNEAGFNTLVEHKGPVELVVKGSIPAWAAGILYRTGPGMSYVETYSKGTYHISHWFDGLAHSHRFEILPPGAGGDRDGGVRVVYRSRRQAEQMAEYIKTTGHLGSVTFAQKADPCVGLFAKLKTVFRPAEPSVHNVHVVMHPNMPDFEHQKPLPASAGHREAAVNLWQATDASVLLRVDPDTLEPIGPARQTALHPELSGPISAAHGQRDPDTGDFFNFNTTPSYVATHRVFRVRADTGTTEILATIRHNDPAPAPATYVHSFFLTRNFVVLCLPVSKYRLGGAQIILKRNLLDSIAEFDENDKCRWFVVDRRHGRGVVARFETPAAFFFHSVNAFEEKGKEEGGEEEEGEKGKGKLDGQDQQLDAGPVTIVADVIEYPNQDIMRAFYYDNLLNRNSSSERFWAPSSGHHATTVPSLVRYRLTVLGGGKQPTVAPAERVLAIPSPHVGELPTINNDFATMRTRYVYSGASRGLGGIMMDTIVKTDVDTSTAVFWTGPPGHTPGEPIFVTRPVAQGGTGEEDDGILLSVVLDGHGCRSYLLCLDARTMRELGRAECDFPVSFGFHGVHSKASL